MAKNSKGIKSKAISVGGKTKVVKVGSKAEKKYLGQGGSFITGQAGEQAKKEKGAYLKSLNNPGSPNYINPETGLNEPGMDPNVPVPPSPPQGIGAVDTSQPSPETVNATPFTGQELGYDQALANLNNSFGKETADQGGPSSQMMSMAQQALKKHYQGGLQAAQASGVPAPVDGGAARGALGNFMPQPQSPQGPSPADMVFDEAAGDPFMLTLTKSFQDYMDSNNQRESLTQEYERMRKKSGIEGLDTSLMNMKNVIEGTEDDIRNEVTKAGGFATESQVAALTNGRNKQLIKNYNNLLETRNSAQQHLDTMVQLSQQDRALADQKFNNMFNMSMQIQNYRTQMQQNAQSSFQRIADKVGYAGLAQMAEGNPYYTNLIEKTLGLGKGGLTQLANYAPPMSESEELDLEAKRLGVKKLKAELAGGSGDRVLTLDESNKYGVPVGTRLSQLTGKTLGTGVSPGLQKENEQDYQFAKLARDNAISGVLKATGKTSISDVTKADMAKLNDAQALALSKSLDITTNPKSAKATGAQDALGPTGWFQNLITNPIRQTLTGKNYSAGNLFAGLQQMEANFKNIESTYFGGGAPIEAPDGSGDTIILED